MSLFLMESTNGISIANTSENYSATLETTLMAKKISYWQATKSILASFVGIQSKKNLERDASDSNMKQFIVIGFSIAVLMHIGIYIIVKIILWQAGVE